MENQPRSSTLFKIIAYTLAVASIGGLFWIFCAFGHPLSEKCYLRTVPPFGANINGKPDGEGRDLACVKRPLPRRRQRIRLVSTGLMASLEATQF